MPLKQSYYCPFDNKTKIIRVPNETHNIFTLVSDSEENSKSLDYKFIDCKTTGEKIHKNIKDGFYKAKDIWEFDNVGVTKPHDLKKAQFIKLKNNIDGNIQTYIIIRYLICGDCNKGALGFGGLLFNEEIKDARIEVGFDLSSTNPNELSYFFYL